MAHNWEIPQLISDGLACLLICRLVFLRLHAVYRVFCCFVIFDLISSGVAFVELSVVRNAHLDYGISFIVMRIIAWVLLLWMVYALLDAVLANFRGILRFSRKLLNITFLVAILVALSTAKPEYAARALGGSADSVTYTVGLVLVLERVICSAALLVLVAILGFILWFPVRLPRNLVVFSIGFVAYLAINTGLLLMESFISHAISQTIGNAVTVLLSLCYGYMALSITAEGERISVSIGHRWNAVDQRKLMRQLEDMNEALIRAARR